MPIRISSKKPTTTIPLRERTRQQLMAMVHMKKAEAGMGRLTYLAVLDHWFHTTSAKTLTADQCYELCGLIDQYQRETEDCLRKAEEERNAALDIPLSREMLDRSSAWWKEQHAGDVPDFPLTIAEEVAERIGGVVRLDVPASEQNAAEGTVAPLGAYWRRVRGG